MTSDGLRRASDPKTPTLTTAISSGHSLHLRQLLASKDETFAIQTISRSPALVAEVRKTLPALRQGALAPAGPHGVEAVLSQRFGLWKPRDRSEGEWRAYWADYHTILQDRPLEALEAAMVEWIKSGATRPPYPGEWLALAKDVQTPKARAVALASRALAAAEADEPKRETVAPGAIASAMSDFREKMERARLAREASGNVRDLSRYRAPISASVGETAVSEELLTQLYGHSEPETAQ